MACLGCLGSKTFIIGAICSVIACLCMIGLPAHPYAPWFEYELTVGNVKNTQELSLTAMLTKGTGDTKFTSLQDWCSEGRTGVWKDFCTKKWIGGGFVTAAIIFSIVSTFAACCQGCKMPGRTCCASTSAVFMILAFIFSGVGVGVFASNKDDLTGYDFGWGFWASIAVSAHACLVAMCLCVGAMQLRRLALGSGGDGESQDDGPVKLPGGIEVVGSKGGNKDLTWV